MSQWPWSGAIYMDENPKYAWPSSHCDNNNYIQVSSSGHAIQDKLADRDDDNRPSVLYIKPA